PELITKTATACAVDGCSKAAKSRGWCETHYSRWRRTGDAGAADLLLQRGRLCSVDGCGRPHRARGYCSMHWKRLRVTETIKGRRPRPSGRGKPGSGPRLLFRPPFVRHEDGSGFFVLGEDDVLVSEVRFVDEAAEFGSCVAGAHAFLFSHVHTVDHAHGVHC